ncbi:MAG: GNAT family N-acetyltransferase [Blastocatellia bacterium]|nr:GNAT family N-acetyltransferase [Blastocatellia bacterium]
MVAPYPTASIFPLTLCDLYSCWALDQRCFDGFEVYELSTFRMLLTCEDSIALKIVEVDGEMKGFLVGMIDRNAFNMLCGSAHIIAVGVAPESRGRGYGNWLMDEAERAFGRAGVTILHLEVRVTNEVALRMYEKLGYVITERRSRYYANGEDGYKMVKELRIEN